MRPWAKGVVIAVAHVGLVASLGARLLYDRATLPRVWARAVPYDPNLPIRGRYVSLQLIVEPRGIEERQPQPGPESQRGPEPRQPVALHVEDGRLVARAASQERRYGANLHVRFLQRQDQLLAVLDEGVAVFIGEHIRDPSRRAPGEELWVEVTIPKRGPPRPIRLGVKDADGPIVPLALR
jgi:hypothetical protein